jgi:hypothetical protein
MLYENETGYIDALERAWTSNIALSGFLLEGRLMAPASMERDLPASGIEPMEFMDQFRSFRQALQFDIQIVSRGLSALRL